MGLRRIYLCLVAASLLLSTSAWSATQKANGNGKAVARKEATAQPRTVTKKTAKVTAKTAGKTTGKTTAKASDRKVVSGKAVDRKSPNSKVTKAKANTRSSTKAKAKVKAAPVAVARPSYGQLAGLHESTDALDLKSGVALIMDQDTSEVLLRKNDHAVLPIASITKLMTGLLISEANLPMDEPVTITQADVDTERGSSSRLVVGTELSRGELLHLALMSSENRAAHALGRTWPGGLQSFVNMMNVRAKTLGMADTTYVEPTGLSSKNQSSARDLATLVNVAYGDPTMRELTTSAGYKVEVGSRTLQYNNTNRLVKDPAWDIGLQKTGYIREAGQCLVMQAKIAGRKLIMVFLDSAGKLSRIADAERVKRWMEGAAGTVGSNSTPEGAASLAVRATGHDPLMN